MYGTRYAREKEREKKREATMLTNSKQQIM